MLAQNTGRTVGLSRESLGLLNYLRGVLGQPLDSWHGFYMAQSPSMNFALRYQLGFSTYALAALAQRTPAYRAPYAEAIRSAIERMLRVETWSYWRAAPLAEGEGNTGNTGNNGRNLAASGHMAVLMGAHSSSSQSLGPPSDPIARDNLQYSGHLSTMLGLYEKLSGDHHYDDPFTLSDPESGVSYTYTHSQVAERIHRQQRESNFGGVCCEKGMAYVPCNNHALASNTLHDALHGTHFSRDNVRWLKTVRDKLVLKGPALRGVFGTAYMQSFHMATPVAFNFTDAWGLAFMLPFDRPLVRKLYSKFKRRGITRAGSQGAYVGSSVVSERMEISDVPINTGFGLILARGIGDTALADALDRYSAAEFEGGWEDERYFYKGAPRTLHANALYALASAIEIGGTDFTLLFNSPPDLASFTEPYLARISAPPAIGVSRAEYDRQGRTLTIALCQVGDLALLRSSQPIEATLEVGNVPSEAYVELDGRPPARQEYSHRDNNLVFSAMVPPVGELQYQVRITGVLTT